MREANWEQFTREDRRSEVNAEIHVVALLQRVASLHSSRTANQLFVAHKITHKTANIFSEWAVDAGCCTEHKTVTPVFSSAPAVKFEKQPWTSKDRHDGFNHRLSNYVTAFLPTAIFSLRGVCVNYSYFSWFPFHTMIILYNVFASFLQDSVVCVVNAAPPLKYFVIYNSPAACAFISYYALTMFYVRVTSCFVGGN